MGVTSVSMRGVSRGLTMGGLIEMLDRASRPLSTQSRGGVREESFWVGGALGV